MEDSGEVVVVAVVADPVERVVVSIKIGRASCRERV